MASPEHNSIRKSDAARRAEIRLTRQFNDLGGLEGEMRYNFSELKREQIHLRRELQRLKFEASKSARADRTHGVIHHAEPTLGFHTEAGHAPIIHRSCTAVVRKTDYGKNFYGYYSVPGSHKKYTRTADDIESSLEDYFHKVDDKIEAEKTDKQLKQQRRENRSVQEHVESWKAKNPAKGTRRKFSINEPPSLRHLAFIRDQLMHKDHELEDKDVTPMSVDEKKTPNPTLSKTVTILPPDHEELTIQSVPPHGATEEEESPDATPVHTSRQEKTRTVTLSLKHKDDDLAFDADLYAPDGRIRMAHRMPELATAIKEARNARYLRTREKREFERQMSMSEIFK